MEFSEDFDWITLDEIIDDIAAMKEARDAAIRDEGYRLLCSKDDLRIETEKILPVLEEVCGEPAEKVIGAGFMTKLEQRFARFAGEGSYYNFVMPFLRAFGVPLARIHQKYLASDGEEKPVHANLAHELAHCASTNESATTLRGMEINARLALEGDTSHRYAFYDVMLGIAGITGVLKAVYEGLEEEFLGLAGRELGLGLMEHFASSIVRQSKLKDHYTAWIYNVLPYKAFKVALSEGSEHVQAAQPPSFSKESMVLSMLLSSVAVLRRLTGKEKEQPIHMPAALKLYRQAKDLSISESQ